MYTVDDICRRWGLAPRTVVKWVQSGRLKALTGSDRASWRFTAHGLNTFHEEHGFSPEYMPKF